MTSNPDYVTAQVVNPQDNPPILAAPSNSSFLLVTFGNTTTDSLPTSSLTSSAGSARKRQATIGQPLFYKATQSFSAVAGGVYNLSAYAADAQNGDSAPNCALSICADSMCGPSQPITTSFVQYSHSYNAQANYVSQVATFSIQCVGQAYVALDNVTVANTYTPPTTSNAASPSLGASSGSSSSSRSRASVRTVTTSIYLTTTSYATQTLTTISQYSSVLLTTAYATATSIRDVTQIVSSVAFSTGTLDLQ